MKFGICTGIEKKDGSVTVPHSAFIKACGFDYVELPLNRVAYLDERELESLKGHLRERNLPCLACNCFMDSSIPMTGPGFDREAFENYVVQAVEKAAALGCEKLVLGSAGSRNAPAGFDLEEAGRQFSACIDFMLEQVKKKGVTLILEHLNLGESNMVTRFEESAKQALLKNDPAFKTILDTYHFCVGGEHLAQIARFKNQIGHVHFARTLGRVYPEPEDFPALEPVLSAIKGARYDGTLSMECAFPKMEEEPPEYGKTLSQFKAYFSGGNVPKYDLVKRTAEARAKGCNCSQSVLCGCAGLIGLDEDTAFRLSEGLGGGIGGTEGVCGAVSAMALAAGLLLSDGTTATKAHTYREVQAMVEEFGDAVGDIQCSTIKGRETGDPLMACDDCILTAARILEKHFL